MHIPKGEEINTNNKLRGKIGIRMKGKRVDNNINCEEI